MGDDLPPSNIKYSHFGKLYCLGNIYFWGVGAFITEAPNKARLLIHARRRPIFHFCKNCRLSHCKTK